MQTIMEEGQNRILDEVRRLGGGVLQDEHMQQPVATGLYQGIDADDEITRHAVWVHKGKFRRVPPGWVFPKCNVHSAYKLWHTQNTMTGQCAMRFLRPADVDYYKDGHRRLEEFRFLMWRFDESARQLGVWRQPMMESDCSVAINAAIEKLGVPLRTPTGRQRHLERLKWPMYLALLPDKRRPSAETAHL